MTTPGAQKEFGVQMEFEDTRSSDRVLRHHGAQLEFEGNGESEDIRGTDGV